ncbi:hypothetical protein BZG35_16610 [Brevundimonas sp. LM2]|uniref:TetR/AcrR family transcriptional regulator n=1 Tax=Brevundimonas sp. LM2 TaxID=1938605 RepID=UPI00098398BC|nr:TetR/AcrR family transcriptional regulator [Brevundimonas sp. LM2]AQR63094.1 hypothetical protein BZG35_16610 [Brevundimonas sp. LM2]
MAKMPREAVGHRREQILDEAQKLFVSHGLQNVTTRHIARAVGISQPSLYAHFPTRDAIAVELCCRAFDQLHDRLTLASDAQGTPSERLHALGLQYIRFGLEQEAAYRVAFMLDMSAEPTVEKGLVLAAGLRAFGMLRALFLSTYTDELEAEGRAQSAWASLHGLVALLIARHEFPWVETHGLIEIHLHGVCSAAFLPTEGHRNAQDAAPSMGFVNDQNSGLR